MSTTRIKDLTTTAVAASNDDYIAIDGATNGTRKIKPSDLTTNITVDSAMSSSSENPVQNKVIYTALSDKANSSSLATVATSGSYSDLSNKPTIKTYTISIASNVITLTDSSGGTSTATLPVYSGGVS